jgi:Collagen triple helix repeat (20 copies)
MLNRVLGHVRGNAVGYVALFAALGGTSYAAVSLAPGSVTTTSLRNGAVTNAKLARNSVSESNLRKHSLTAADFKVGALTNAIKTVTGPAGPAGTSGKNGANGTGGVKGLDGTAGASGPTGATGAAGADGSASVVMKARGAGNVAAPHGASTDVPLTGASWTQAGSDLNLVTGSMSLGIPSSCTGSFGNALVVSVDGVPNTIALAPTLPASNTVTVPFVVSEMMEPGASAQHTVTAKLSNSCTKSGEDYAVSNVKIDVVNFH